MEDEIKEILDELESLFEISEAPEHIINGFNKIKDYITNLQEIADVYNRKYREVKMLKEQLLYEKENTKVYKSRNEKAIEYIELWHYRNDYRVNSFTTGCKNDLLNILQGVGKDE